MTGFSTSFPSDLGISTRVGLTHGVGTLNPLPGSFGEAEARFREERLLAEAALRRERRATRARRAHPAPPVRRTAPEPAARTSPLEPARRTSPERGLQRAGAPGGGSSRQGVSRWTTWSPSALLHRSSRASQSSSSCGA